MYLDALMELIAMCDKRFDIHLSRGNHPQSYGITIILLSLYEVSILNSETFQEYLPNILEKSHYHIASYVGGNLSLSPPYM